MLLEKFIAIMTEVWQFSTEKLNKHTIISYDTSLSTKRMLHWNLFPLNATLKIHDIGICKAWGAING